MMLQTADDLRDGNDSDSEFSVMEVSALTLLVGWQEVHGVCIQKKTATIIPKGFHLERVDEEIFKMQPANLCYLESDL